MQIKPIKTSLFKENQNLADFVLKYAKSLREGSVLVITSKIVALSEGRVAPISQKEKLIKSESSLAIKAKYVWLTVKDGMVMASAGIDESNAKNKLILSPRDSFNTAENIRKILQKKFKIKKLGVLITDSGLVPLRAGVIGLALGYAGFKGLKSYIGKRDLHGRKFVYSNVNIADALATAAIITMGEGSERQPLAVISGAPIEFTNKINKKELIMNPKKDIYAPLFNKFN